MELTEERVREIVREEIERHDAEQFKDLRANLAKDLTSAFNGPPFGQRENEGRGEPTG